MIPLSFEIPLQRHCKLFSVLIYCNKIGFRYKYMLNVQHFRLATNIALNYYLRHVNNCDLWYIEPSETLILRSWLITGFVSRLTRRVSLVEQELLTLPEHLSSPQVFSGVRVSRPLVLYVCFVDRCLSFIYQHFNDACICYISDSICRRSVWRYQRGNQNPYIEEEQTAQWPKEKVQKDKQRSTKHTYKTSNVKRRGLVCAQ
jgi:hypothetical protein